MGAGGSSFDVTDPAIYRDDCWQEIFASLRRQGPLVKTEGMYGPIWSAVGYDQIMEIELNPQLFSSRADLGGIQLVDIASGLDRPSFVGMDPPEHTPRRRAVTPMTRGPSLRSFESLIRERTAEVLEALPVGESFDWVERVSIDLTARMLATMFDFPQERRLELMYWSDVATANLLADDAPVRTEEERYAVLQEMAEAFVPYWQEREGRADGFDLITMLANDPATQQMDRPEFIGTLFLLIVGGNDTTRNSMSGGLLALHDNPEQLEKVRADRGLIPNMVSEIIRFHTPVIHMRRTALHDTELAGQAIAKGDKVVMWYVSGNRDETVFPDAGRFEVSRENARRHLAFGAGIHRCVGDRLAELQLRVLWEEILDRRMVFEVAGPPRRVYSNFIRGISSLPVRRTA